MKKYPAQIRYEKKHPVISFRLDRDLKKRLEKVLEEKSFADFVKEGLGVREREKKSLDYEHRQGFREGVKAGYDHALEVYGVYTYCKICGEKVMVTGEREKNEIDMYLRRRGMCHTGCIEEEERRRRKDQY